jgi:hypothetical protein
MFVIERITAVHPDMSSQPLCFETEVVSTARSASVTIVIFSGITTDTSEAYDMLFARTHTFPVISRTNPVSQVIITGVVVAMGVVVRVGAEEPTAHT